MSNIKIKNIVLYIFLIIIFGITLSGGILYFSLLNLTSLNKKIVLIADTKNDFLKVKLNTETLLITTDLAVAKEKWILAIEKFDKRIPSLDEKQKKVFSDSWYISKKEIEEIKLILNDDLLKPHNLEKKSISMLKGEMFALNEKTQYYSLVLSLINKIEFLKQYEEFILKDLEKMHDMQRDNINKQISQIITNTIFSTIITSILMLISIYILNKKIIRIEYKLILSKDELNKNLRKLKEAKLLLKNIIDSVPVSIFWKSSDGKYMGLNKKFLENTKYETIDEVIGKTDQDMPWSGTIAEQFRKTDQEVITTGKSKLQVEEKLIKDNGDIVYLLKSKVPLKNIRNQTIGVLGVFMDITQTKEMYNELNLKDKLLTQQSKMAAMGEMLENIAHQWRQPLSMISSVASGMSVKKDYDMLDDEYFEESIKHIMESSSYLNQTIEDFRSYFKEDKELVYFPLVKSVEKALFLSNSKIQNRSINIVNNLSSIDAFGLENEFIQVLINIINNAIDILEENDISNKIILLKSFKKDKYLGLEIQDNAGGIPENIIHKIFDPYFTTKGSKKGTGIGLHMSKEMIEKHMNGSIDVSNERFEFEGIEYMGAKFILKLPSKASV